MTSRRDVSAVNDYFVYFVVFCNVQRGWNLYQIHIPKPLSDGQRGALELDNMCNKHNIGSFITVKSIICKYQIMYPIEYIFVNIG